MATKLDISQLDFEASKITKNFLKQQDEFTNYDFRDLV